MSQTIETLLAVINQAELHAASAAEAWTIAKLICSEDLDDDPICTYDPERSQRAGYDVYDVRSDEDSAEEIATISNLGARLEVNFTDGETYQIWINHHS